MNYLILKHVPLLLQADNMKDKTKLSYMDMPIHI